MMRGRTPAAVTKPVIIKMSSNDAGNSDQQERYPELSIELFQYKKYKTKTEDKNGDKQPVMFYVTMKKGIRTDRKGQDDHTPFKIGIVNDVNAKYRQGGYQYR
jgi:hypothetical protein